MPDDALIRHASSILTSVCDRLPALRQQRGTTASHPLCRADLSPARLEALLGLVDHVDAAPATHQTAVAMAVAQALERSCESSSVQSPFARSLRTGRTHFFAREVREVSAVLKTRKTAGQGDLPAMLRRGIQDSVCPVNHGHALSATNLRLPAHPDVQGMACFPLVRRVLFAGSASPKVRSPATSPCCLTTRRRKRPIDDGKRQPARPERRAAPP